MSLGKLPVISWVSGSHNKRRLKGDLTPDMISPPLGDFRHTMHVGRGGDAFGDTSFLRNHGGEAAKPNNFFARTLRHVRRSPLRNRGSRSNDEASPTPPAISPIIKNAISLPQLNEDNYGNDGCGVNFVFKSTPNSFSDYGLESGFCTIPRAPRSEKTQDSSHTNELALARSDSLLSFRLDLGPSLMSELLHVISFPGDLCGKDRGEEENEESKTSNSSETSSPFHLKKSTWKSGSLHNNCEESKVSSGFWSHSEASLPLGHSVYNNGDSHSIELSQEGSPYSREKSPDPGAVAAKQKETHWQGHQNDCNIEAREFDHATQVLASHYGPRSTYHSLQEQEESGSQESPDANAWCRTAGMAVQQAHRAGWHRRAEEEEEEDDDFSGDCSTTARDGHSDSFEYVDEDEEDEVKV
ncbi:cdc42 effector protein 1 [Paroedura picta]|uniref:cdc42 effector protein 1 n=1 Tax=Paroedura picta TaxID=143630 RepID=UPI00405623BF